MDNATCCGHELHPEFEARKVQQKERARQVKAKQKAKEKKDKEKRKEKNKLEQAPHVQESKIGLLNKLMTNQPTPSTAQPVMIDLVDDEEVSHYEY